MNLRPAAGVGALLALLAPCIAFAEDAAPTPVLNTGDTAWMLTSTALVLFMTIPGLALFYGGMVRSKNVLSVMMQCFAITALIQRSVGDLWLQPGVRCHGHGAGRRQLQFLLRRPGQGIPGRRHAGEPDCTAACSRNRCSSPSR